MRIEAILTAVRHLLFDCRGLISLCQKLSPATEQDRNWCGPEPKPSLPEPRVSTPATTSSHAHKLYLNFTTSPQNHICAYASWCRSYWQKTTSSCSPFTKLSYESSREVVVIQRIQRVCETAQVSVPVSIAGAGLRTEVEPPFSEPIEDLAATGILPNLHSAQCRRLSLLEISFQFPSTLNVLGSVNPIEPMPRPDRCLMMAKVYSHQIDVRGREFCCPGSSRMHHVTAGLLHLGLSLYSREVSETNSLSACCRRCSP
jgi:hypothetical protein